MGNRGLSLFRFFREGNAAKALAFALLLALSPAPSRAAAPASEAPLSTSLKRETFLQPYRYQGGAIPVAFFDADNTLRIATTGAWAPVKPEEVILLPGVARKIRELSDAGYFVAVASNQREMLKQAPLADVDATMQRTAALAEGQGGKVHYYDFATNDAEAKPGPFLFQRLQEKLQAAFGPQARIDLGRSFMVGDAAYEKARPGKPADLRPNGQPGTDFSNFDRKFAENNGLKFYEPDEFFGWNRYGSYRFQTPQDLVAHEERRQAALKAAGCPEAFNGLP